MELTAVFDSVDIAELALIRLREQGISPLAYKIKRTRAFSKDKEIVPEDGVKASFTNSVGGMAQTPVMSLNLWHKPLLSAQKKNAGQEVRLIVTVADSGAVKTRGVLVSNHGRRVRFL